jgi:putative oxidoreductase
MKNIFSTSQNPLLINYSLLLLRAGTGILMLTHGWPKLVRLLTADEIMFPDPLGIGTVPSLVLAVVAEFFGSILLILGLATRPAAFLILITMVVAVFIVHAGDPFSRMELGLLYLLNSLILVITGGGNFSLDRYINIFSRFS